MKNNTENWTVIRWDWKDSIDACQLRDALVRVSAAATCWEVETDSDSIAIVVCAAGATTEEAQAFYNSVHCEE